VRGGGGGVVGDDNVMIMAAMMIDNSSNVTGLPVPGELRACCAIHKPCHAVFGVSSEGAVHL
jgi:hypothetical protein